MLRRFLGEHIIDVIVWANAAWVYGLEFTTSDGRVSPHFGGEAGTPTVVSSEDGILVAFSVLITSNLFHRMQVSSVYCTAILRVNQRGTRQFGVTML